jgi:hypothetical protein
MHPAPGCFQVRLLPNQENFPSLDAAARSKSRPARSLSLRAPRPRRDQFSKGSAPAAAPANADQAAADGAVADGAVADGAVADGAVADGAGATAEAVAAGPGAVATVGAVADGPGAAAAAEAVADGGAAAAEVAADRAEVLRTCRPFRSSTRPWRAHLPTTCVDALVRVRWSMPWCVFVGPAGEFTLCVMRLRP